MISVGYTGVAVQENAGGLRMDTKVGGSMDRRSFLGMMAAGATLALAGCKGPQEGTAGGASSSASTTDLSGRHLSFVGDDAFAPYRYVEMQSDGTQKVVGLDIEDRKSVV